MTYDLLNLISQGMGPDLHWFPEDVSVSRLAATLVGMANSSGGTVLIGISPRSGQIQGVKDVEETVDRVFQAALLSDPPLVLPVPQAVTGRSGGLPGPVVLRIEVPCGLPHVYNLQGSYLGREGRQTYPLSARTLRRLLIERGSIQFETRLPPEATLEDLDPIQVEAYLAALHVDAQASGQERQAGGPEPEPEQSGGLSRDAAVFLLRRGCLQRVGEGKLRPTYAGLLLFGRHAQQWVPNATILAARFSGLTFADEFIKQDIRGTLPEQLQQAEQFIHEYVTGRAGDVAPQNANQPRSVRMVGLAHQEMRANGQVEYPFEAVRELLVNAVAHRDYNVQGDNIHLNLFSDRLEVQSPGALPGPVTLDNLLEARFSRNAVIAQALSDLGYVERLGYGLDRVVAVMRTNRMRPPRFEETAGCFRVTLYARSEAAEAREASIHRQPRRPGAPTLTTPMELPVLEGVDLNTRQEAALGYIALHRRITNSSFQELCPEVHPETLRRDLSDLVSRGILIKVGDKKATYYILK